MFKGLYFPNGELSEAREVSRHSWLWASVMEGIDVIKKGALCTIIWNGGKVRVWRDRWIPRLRSSGYRVWK